MIVHVCKVTESAVFEFPGEETVNDHLTVNGLHPSSTYFYITQDIVGVAGCRTREKDWQSSNNHDEAFLPCMGK